MPIKQERMLTLLEAADAFSTTLRAASAFINETASAITPDSDRETLLTAIQQIQQYFALTSIPHRLLEAIAEEKAHFKLNRARNERHARRSKLKRAGLRPATPALPAPPTFQQHPPLSDIELARQGYDDSLTSKKIEINAVHRASNLPEPYLDPYDNSIPLLPDHGGPAPDDTIF